MTDCRGWHNNLPWAYTATFESGSSLPRHLPLSPTPPLFSCTCVSDTIGGWLAAKLASASWVQIGGKKTMYGKLSWTLHRGSEGAQRRYWEITTYFHFPWSPRLATCPSTCPVTFQVPDDTDNWRTEGSAVLCPSNVTRWQSRWQHSPPTFPESGAFKCSSKNSFLSPTELDMNS